ncbi:MAG: DUF2975 domain-containing protein [Actinomycetota bacterium]
MNRSAVVDLTRVVLIVGMAAELILAVSFLLGPNGVGIALPDLGGWIPEEGLSDIHAEGVLAEPPVVVVDLAWESTTNGATDISTGLPAVELSGPYTAVVNVLNPSRGEQIAYVTIRSLTAVLAAVVLWVLLRIVSSVRTESPFTAINAKRIWTLAGLIAIGGTLSGAANALLNNTLIQNSAAADAFISQATLPFAPLIAGLLLAVLSITWNRGLALEEDTEGLI